MDIVNGLFPSDVFELKAEWLEPREGETEYPNAVRFLLHEDDFQKVKELFGITTRYIPIIFSTAGFFPKIGEIYNCRLSHRGRVIYAFPESPRTEKDWSPGYFYPANGLDFVRGEKGYSARHPLTGQFILPARELELDSRTESKIHIAPEGMAARPRLSGGFWIYGPEKILKGISEDSLNIYDEAEAKRLKMKYETFQYATEYNVLNLNLTVFELFGTPHSSMGRPATSIEELAKFGKLWLENIDRWVNRVFQAGVHEDVAFTSMSTEEKSRAIEITRNSRNALDEAANWAGFWLQWALEKAEARRSAGLPTAFKTPPRRNPNQAQTRVLMELKAPEIKQELLEALEREVPSLNNSIPGFKKKSPSRVIKPAPKVVEKKPPAKRVRKAPIEEVIVATSGDGAITIADDHGNGAKLAAVKARLEGKPTAKKPAVRKPRAKKTK